MSDAILIEKIQQAKKAYILRIYPKKNTGIFAGIYFIDQYLS